MIWSSSCTFIYIVSISMESNSLIIYIIICDGVGSISIISCYSICNTIIFYSSIIIIVIVVIIVIYCWSLLVRCSTITRASIVGTSVIWSTIIEVTSIWAVTSTIWGYTSRSTISTNIISGINICGIVSYTCSMGIGTYTLETFKNTIIITG